MIVTHAVPPAEVRPAVSLNSVTETSAIVAMNVGGSALLMALILAPALLLRGDEGMWTFDRFPSAPIEKSLGEPRCSASMR